MLALGFGFWEDWELRDKVTFNMLTRIISVNPDVANIDVKIDIYSAWKRWMLVDDNNKIGQVVRVIGGDPTTQGQTAGDIYFLVNGWRLQVDLGQTAVKGSIFSDDFDSPLIDFDNNLVFQSLVSSLVTGIDLDPVIPPTATEVAQQVWDMQTTLAQLAGSFGKAVTDINSEMVKLRDLWIIRGLDPDNPMNANKLTGRIKAGDIDITVTGDGINDATFTRDAEPSLVTDELGNFLTDEFGNFIEG